jgi:hypothetical protein
MLLIYAGVSSLLPDCSIAVAKRLKAKLFPAGMSREMDYCRDDHTCIVPGGVLLWAAPLPTSFARSGEWLFSTAYSHALVLKDLHHFGRRQIMSLKDGLRLYIGRPS